MNEASIASIDRRLARVEGQVGGLRRMLKEGSYCIDILTQLGAVKSALDQVGAELAAAHVQSCIAGHGSGSEHECSKPMTQEELIDELRITLSRLMK